VTAAKGRLNEIREAPLTAEPSGRSLVTGGVLLMLGRATVVPVGLIATAFLARVLGPADFGLFSVGLSVIVWARVTVFMLFNRASVLLIAESSQWESVAIALIQIQLLLGTLVGAAVFLAAPVLANALGEPGLNPMIRLLAFSIPVSTLAQAYENTLDARRKFRRSALFPVVYQVSWLLLVLLLVGAGLGLTGAALAALGAAVVELWFALGSFRLQLWRRVTIPRRRFLRYSLPLFLDTLAKRLHKRMDLWAVQILAGATSAGYYSAALGVNSIGLIFTDPLSRLTLATVSGSWAHGRRDEARSVIRQCLRVTLWLTPFAALGAGAAPSLITLVFGDAYLPAAPILAWVSLTIVGLVIMSLTAAIFAAVGRPGYAFLYNVPLLLLAVLGYLVLVPRVGAVGAAATNAVTVWAVAVATMFAVRRWCQVSPGLSTGVRIGVISAAAYVLASVWSAPGVWVIPQLLALCGVVVLLLFILGELTRSDLSFAVSLLKRVRGADDRVESLVA
jgi:O-antigen/teichoic acid export membrane protein